MKRPVGEWLILATMTMTVAGCEGGGSVPRAVGGDGFQASVRGAVDGSIAGPGVLRFLPPSRTVIGTRSGYYFLADDTGVRDLGITFTIPAGTGPGTYALVSGSPLEVGRNFEVRVDHSTADGVVSFSRETEGSLTLVELPGIADSKRVTGNFRFTTQNPTGTEVEVDGTFEFKTTANGGGDYFAQPHRGYRQAQL